MAKRATTQMPEVVAEARQSLSGGSERLVPSKCSLRHAWFPVETTPSFQEQLLSDYGVLPGNPIAIEFEEEVGALIDAISRRSDQESLEEIRSQEDKSAMLTALTDRMGTRPLALDLWDLHGTPVRLKESLVFRILSPNDVMGDPIIRAYPADRYVTEVSVKTAELTHDLTRLRAAVVRWRIIAASLLGVLVLLVWLLTNRA